MVLLYTVLAGKDIADKWCLLLSKSMWAVFVLWFLPVEWDFLHERKKVERFAGKFIVQLLCATCFSGFKAWVLDKEKILFLFKFGLLLEFNCSVI